MARPIPVTASPPTSPRLAPFASPRAPRPPIAALLIPASLPPTWPTPMAAPPMAACLLLFAPTSTPPRRRLRHRRRLRPRELVLALPAKRQHPRRPVPRRLLRRHPRLLSRRSPHLPRRRPLLRPHARRPPKRRRVLHQDLRHRRRLPQGRRLYLPTRRPRRQRLPRHVIIRSTRPIQSPPVHRVPPGPPGPPGSPRPVAC